MAGTLNKGSLVKSSGGSGGGGSASFPTIVTDSGSSLPVDLSGYNEGDTFLNTSDKKIYKTGETITGYSLATGVTNTATFDSTTGIVSGFGSDKNIYKSFAWEGSFTFQVKFKFTYIDNSDYCIIDFYGYNSGQTNYGSGVAFFLTNKKIHYVAYSNSGDSYSKNTNTEIINHTLETNKEYILVIKKTGTSCIVDLKFDDTTISSESFSVSQYLNHTNKETALGTKRASPKVPSWINIYLGETSGDFVTATTGLIWDTGTSLTDKTEYADKTNGALYLYENSELVKIGGNLTKKVYTINADNTSTLDVSSDFTKVVDVLKNGVELAITDDYTSSSGVITFVTALSTTDKITVKGE